VHQESILRIREYSENRIIDSRSSPTPDSAPALDPEAATASTRGPAPEHTDPELPANQQQATSSAQAPTSADDPAPEAAESPITANPQATYSKLPQFSTIERKFCALRRLEGKTYTEVNLQEKQFILLNQIFSLHEISSILIYDKFYAKVIVYNGHLTNCLLSNIGWRSVSLFQPHDRVGTFGFV
jgi:hypothetical protein